MANINDALALIYEALKDHEKNLFDLMMDVEALKMRLTPSERTLLQKTKKKNSSVLSAVVRGKLQLYDVQIKGLQK